MKQQASLSVLALACLSLLAACGGGGGGNGSPPVTGAPPAQTPAPVSPAPGPAPVAPVTPADPSLIPAPATAGVVLYTDIAPLRMLSGPGTRTYRGTDQLDGAAAGGAVYTNKVSLADNGGGVYAEQHANLFNGGASTLGALRLQNNAVLASALVAFRDGAPKLAETLTELRGPIRADEQFGAFERKNVDIGVDLDGDKINETATVAQYSQVVGNTSVDLPNRPGVAALRVDTRLRVQITPSATKLPGPVQETLRSTWYAPGLGIVRQRLEHPNAVAGKPNRVVTEALQEWDGGSEGLGALPTQVPLAPASTPFAGSRLQFPQAVAGFATHAVVAASIADRPISRGIVLAQIDPRGAIVAAREYSLAELFPGADYMLELRLLAHGNFLRLTARLDDGSIRMAHFDATGQTIVNTPTNFGAESPLARDADGLSYRMTTSSGAFHHTWFRERTGADGLSYRSAYVYRTSALGGLQTMPRDIIQPVVADIRNFTTAEDLGAIGYSWLEKTAQTAVRRVATIGYIDEVVKRQTLDLPAGACLEADMAALQTGLAITCWNVGATGFAAARLDAEGKPIVAEGGSLAGETIKAPWLLPFTTRPVVLGANGELHVAGEQRGPYWEGEADSYFVTVWRTNAGNSRLTSADPVLLARVRDLPGTVRHVVKVGNRLMLIGSDANFYMSTTPVWLTR